MDHCFLAFSGEGDFSALGRRFFRAGLSVAAPVAKRGGAQAKRGGALV
jgi:hypothetical protein